MLEGSVRVAKARWRGRIYKSGAGTRSRTREKNTGWSVVSSVRPGGLRGFPAHDVAITRPRACLLLFSGRAANQQLGLRAELGDRLHKQTRGPVEFAHANVVGEYTGVEELGTGASRRAGSGRAVEVAAGPGGDVTDCDGDADDEASLE